MSDSSLIDLLNGNKNGSDLFDGLKVSSLANSTQFSEFLDQNRSALIAALANGSDDDINTLLQNAVDNDQDRAIISGNSDFSEALRIYKISLRMANDFSNAYYAAEPIDLDALFQKHAQSQEDLAILGSYRSELEEGLQHRQKSIEEIAYIAGNIKDKSPDECMAEATEIWIKNVAHAKPQLYKAATTDAAPLDYKSPFSEDFGSLPNAGLQVSDTFENEPKIRRNSYQADSFKSIFSEGFVATDSATPPSQSNAKNDEYTPPSGRTLPAANLKDLKYGEIGEEGLITRAYSILQRDGAHPYGAYNAEKEKKQMESMAFPKYVIPENKKHFQHYLVQYTWPESYGAKARALMVALQRKDSTVPLPYKSLPNFYADTLYAREIVKAVDGRMKASGVSEAVYDMQVKMRDLNYKFQQGSALSYDEYKNGMRKIYADFLDPKKNNNVDIKISAAKFVASMKPILEELRERANGAENPDPSIPMERRAFKYSSDAKGKTGLTLRQTQNALVYYTDLTKSVERVAGGDPDFLEKYLSLTKEPDDIDNELSRRAAVTDVIKTALLGYHDEDGVVVGSRLGRMGADVEMRNSGYNVFKLYDKDTLPGYVGKTHFSIAREDTVCQLERGIDVGMASPYDRIPPVKSRGGATNGEATYFFGIHDHEKKEQKWGVDAQNTYVTQTLRDLFNQGYETDILGRMIRRNRYAQGADTSRQTMPFGAFEAGLKALAAEFPNDKHVAFICKEAHHILVTIEQSPADSGFREMTKKFSEKVTDNVDLYTLFADYTKHEVPIPLKPQMLGMLGVVDAAIGTDLEYKIGKATRLNIPTSYPKVYEQLMESANAIIKPLAFALGMRTVSAKQDAIDKKQDLNSLPPFKADKAKWGDLFNFWKPLRLLGVAFPNQLGGWAYQADPNKTARENMKERINHYTPSIIKSPVNLTVGSILCALPEGKKYAGAMATTASRAFYLSAALFSATQVGGHFVSPETISLGDSLRNSFNYTITPQRIGLANTGYISPIVPTLVDKAANEIVDKTSYGVSQAVFDDDRLHVTGFHIPGYYHIAKAGWKNKEDIKDFAYGLHIPKPSKDTKTPSSEQKPSDAPSKQDDSEALPFGPLKHIKTSYNDTSHKNYTLEHEHYSPTAITFNNTALDVKTVSRFDVTALQKEKQDTFGDEVDYQVS